MADRVGQQLGNYRLLRLLGQGAFAAVYLGEHQYLERLAAIKVLHVQIEPAKHESFRREARTIAQLDHPHIIGVHEFGIEDQTPYLVMEYTPNGTLRSQHPKGTQLSFEQIVTYVKQIASALDYAHQQRVIHRDIKPENILLNSKHEVILSDFGIAVVQHTLDSLSTQNTAGTPLYMAPEQIQRKPCAASDQYALGVMVYEWLCGEPPFHGSLFEVFSQHLHKPPPSLCARMPQLPPAVEDAVFGALAKDPEQRFGSVTDFATVLSEASLTTQTLSLGKSVEHEVQKEIKRPFGRLRLVPVPSPSKQDHSDEATQPPLKTAQHIEPNPKIVSSVASQPAQSQSASKQRTAVHQQTRASALQDQNRVRMLRRLRRSYSDLMSQSLQGAAWLELGLADKPDAVQNATNLLLRVSNRTGELLPAGASITQAYDEVEHELLILGEPGAGKSTLLLDLAQQLVLRAKQDKMHPLPVILPLSSWAVKRPPLQDWIAEQLVEIYDVPRKLSKQWVQEDGILPLLDGLDEMEEAARPACIAAINTYHRDHLAELVVCSRTTEYEAAAERHRLALQGAVAVQPLAHENVDAYLVQAGKALTGLHSALKENTALHDLATTPLMLNILTLTYQGTSVRDLPNMESHLLQQVWDDYVQRMVERKGNSKRYPLEQTRSRLGWLARQMREHNQTVFYLEHLQPDWLSISQQRTYAWRAVRLPAIVIGALISVLSYVFFIGDTDALSLFQYGVLGGVLGGLWHESAQEQRSQEDHRHIRGKRLLKRLVLSACVGLIFDLSFGFAGLAHAFASIAEYPPGFNFYGMLDGILIRWLICGLSYGIGIGLGCLVLQYILAAPFHSGTSSGNGALRQWKRVARFWSAVQGSRSLLVAVIIALSYGLSVGLTVALEYELSGGNHDGLGEGLTSVQTYGLSIGLSYGLTYGLISLILSAQMRDIHLTERIRWTWNNLRKGLFNSRHLGLTVFLACAATIFSLLSTGLSHTLSNTLGYAWHTGLMNALMNGLSVGLRELADYELIGSVSFGLIFGLSFWCLFGLFQGIAQERIEDQDRRVTNQGIHRSLRNSVIMGIIGGVTIGSMKILSNLLNIGLSGGLTSALSGELMFGLNSLIEELIVGIRDGLDYWLSYWLSIALPAGICAGLLVCIVMGGLATLRHYMLRLLLLRTRTFPWRAPQFLDDAAARFLLRRIGGGYSFTHRLLLDYFASLETPSIEEATVPSVIRDSLPVISRAPQIGITDQENNTSSPSPNRKTGFHKEKHTPILFAAVIFLIVITISASIFGIIQTQKAYDLWQQFALATSQANEAASQANATSQAQANTTAEALANTLPIVYPPSNLSPVLDDPLQDNSKGSNWEVDGPGGDCTFINRAYGVNAGTNLPSSGQFSQEETWSSVETTHGRLRPLNASSSAYPITCPAKATNFTNFIYEVQMKVVSGYGGGIAFLIDPTDSSRFYDFTISPDGSYWVSGASGGFSSAIHQGLNQTNLIAVVARGKIIELYVNLQRVAIVGSDASTQGRIGITAIVSSAYRTEVIFQNAKVWEL